MDVTSFGINHDKLLRGIYGNGYFCDAYHWTFDGNIF